MTMSSLDRVCTTCGSSGEDVQLQPCPFCFRTFCADCAVKSAGRRFCSDSCGRSYFYSGDEDEETDDFDKRS